MNDIALWHRLAAGETLEAADLEALADLPLGQRGPFLGAIAAAYREPALRRLAVRALCGASGMVALRLLHAALDDDDEQVRGAAVAGFRAAAGGDPARYAHVLFHPRADVRRAALLAVPTSAAHQGTYLRADPACAERAAASPWPRFPLALVLDLWRRGVVATAEATQVFLQQPRDHLLELLRRYPGRSPATVDSFLASSAAAKEPVVAAGFDVIDAILELAASDGCPEPQALHERLAPGRKHGALRRRVLAAILAQRSRRALSAGELGLAVALEPRLIGWPLFTPDMVPAAADGLRSYRHLIVTPGPATVRELLALPVAEARDGPRLSFAAALVQLLPGRRLEAIAERFGLDTLLEAIAAGPHRFTALCELPPESKRHELRWLGQVRHRDRAAFLEAAARALVAWSDDRERAGSFLVWLQAGDRGAVLLRLAALLDDGSLVVPESRLEALAMVAGERLDAPALASYFAAALLAPGPHSLMLAMAMARTVAIPALVTALGAAAAEDVLAFLDPGSAMGLPWDREVALARAFAAGLDPKLKAWARDILAPPAVAAARPLVRPGQARPLTAAQAERIRECPEHELTAALTPALDAPVTGLCAALGARARPGSPSPAACAALLGCGDEIWQVAPLLDRFGDNSAAVTDAIDLATVRAWERAPNLSLLGNARLHRWEFHKQRLGDQVEAWGGVLACLRQAADESAGFGPVATETLWRGVAAVLLFWRYRDRPRFLAQASPLLADVLCEQLTDPIGVHAARMLVTLIEGRALGGQELRIRDQVRELAADVAPGTREVLVRITSLEGIPSLPARRAAPPASDLDLAQVRRIRDSRALASVCADARLRLVEEAVLCLLERGADGEAHLAEILASRRPLPHPRPLIDSIGMWVSAGAVAAVREVPRDPAVPVEVRFRLALALVERGAGELIEVAIAAACEPLGAGGTWFERADFDRLARQAGLDRTALALATAPHHHAHQLAISRILEWDRADEPVRDALRGFLDAGTGRPLHLRRAAAVCLVERWNDAVAAPLLLRALAEPDAVWPAALFPVIADPRICRGLLDMAIIGGHRVCTEARLADLLDEPSLAVETRAAARTALLEHGTVPVVRQRLARVLSTADVRARNLAAVGEVFAWGVRRGLELTGRLYRVHMTGGEGQLGYTYLDQHRVFVSALPILRGERNGRDIVEGLILHELGHHVHHGGPAAAAVWQRAGREGLGDLLNLIADEHLERNLRAVDAGHGDQLKRLGAYAFQHAAQEIGVEVLLGLLGGAAFEVLTATTLGIAFQPGAVRIERGPMLAALAERGHPLARFTRALRLGLGNRDRDPLVAEALALFDRGFRRLDMDGLYRLTVRVAELFGGAVEIARVFGGSEGITWSERDGDVDGAGIDDDQIQREVERILDPRRRAAGASGRRPERLQINVSADRHFERITRIERVRGGQDAYRVLGAGVRRHAARLRAHLDELGLRWQPVRGRVQGRAVDRTRVVRNLVIRRDPRFLVARQSLRENDLFIGVMLDCSGSMNIGGSMDRAQRFGVLIAEAARGLPGVEARFFGFTDAVIFDAGDADRCAVGALEPQGGNNDAAALLHVAGVADASRRRARVLVMISDGLPTECSVTALRNLVTELSRRRGLLCAQVAVRPLEEVCFGHHVVLDDDAIDVAVARFGRLIADLARRSLRS